MPPMDVDSFTLPGYDVPDAHPASIDPANGERQAIVDYKIPLVVWMFAFLVLGYIGLRSILED